MRIVKQILLLVENGRSYNRKVLRTVGGYSPSVGLIARETNTNSTDTSFPKFHEIEFRSHVRARLFRGSTQVVQLNFT